MDDVNNATATRIIDAETTDGRMTIVKIASTEIMVRTEAAEAEVGMAETDAAVAAEEGMAAIVAAKDAEADMMKGFLFQRCSLFITPRFRW